jgi:two-component system chemotaxis response regulator CheB
VTRKVRVLIVDDSAAIRSALAGVLGSDPDIEVVATAADPYIAVERLGEHGADVITLDVEMPRMDGLSFLEKLMAQHPIPVVMCSSLTSEGSDAVLAALQRGAVDIIAKPKLGAVAHLRDQAIQICDTVKAAARARPRRLAPPPAPKLTADAILPAARPLPVMATDRVIALGASTGGTEALLDVLRRLPPDAPGVVVVQHMPERFTELFAKRLDAACAVRVKEAEHGDAILRGRVLVAPGNRHMLVRRSGARYTVDLRDGPLVSRHRPSVDVLFRSAARYAGRNAIGAILTGMGDDGARGMRELRDAGAHTIAQDEASCVVFGMPGAAIARDGVDEVLPLEAIAGALLRRAEQRDQRV